MTEIHDAEIFATILWFSQRWNRFFSGTTETDARRCFDPVFFSFFLADLSYVGFVPVGDLLDNREKHFVFGTRINPKISIYFWHQYGRRAIFQSSIFFSFFWYKPIGASPCRDYVVKRMVLVQKIEYNLVLTLSWCRDIKKGRNAPRLRIKWEILILRKPPIEVVKVWFTFLVLHLISLLLKEYSCA